MPLLDEGFRPGILYASCVCVQLKPAKLPSKCKNGPLATEKTRLSSQPVTRVCSFNPIVKTPPSDPSI
jgi:hypothetical protein